MKWSHPGRLINLPGKLLGGARYSCCYRKEIKRGCQARWECCQGDQGGIGCRTRYTCCKEDIAIEDSDKGCQKRYACCRGRMQDQGCTQVCFSHFKIISKLRISLRPLIIHISIRYVKHQTIITHGRI